MKILKQIALWLAGIVGLLIALIYAVSVWEDYQRYSNGLKGYMGLNIGASRQEATYAFGEPKYVLSEIKRNPKGEYRDIFLVEGEDERFNSKPKDRAITSYNEWVFDKSGYRAIVSFDPSTKAVTAIACTSNEDTGSGLCPPIYGVWVGDSEDGLMAKLGPADKFKYHGTVKIYYWQKLGLEVYLTEKRVYEIQRRDTAKGQSIGWLVRRILF